MRGSFRRKAAAAVLAFLVAAGCGPGEDEGGGAGAAREDFIEQAGAICEARNQEFNALFETDFPVIRARTPAFFEKAVPIIENRQSELKRLEIPEGDEEEINSMLGSGDMAVEDFRRAARDQELARELFSQGGGENSMAFEGKAREYGIEQCASGEGGDEDEDEPVAKVDISGFSAEKKAYIENGDAICEAADEKFQPVEEELFGDFPPTNETWKAGIPKVIEIYRPAFAEFEGLTPPAADQPAIGAIVQKEESLIASLEEANGAAASDDEARLEQTLRKIFPLFDEVDRDRRAFGFQVCGSEDQQEG